MDNKVEISIILGTYNRLKFLKSALKSIRRETKKMQHEIIVVDGGSSDGTLKWLINQKDIITIVQHNHGKCKGKPVKRRSWGYFMNLGFKCAQGKYLCMLSDDCLVVPGAIINGYNLFEKEQKKGNNVGAVAFYWRNWSEQDQYFVGLTLGNKMFVNHGMYLRTAIEEIGFCEEDLYQFYHADGDWCLKMWEKGYEVIDSPKSFIEHFPQANRRVRRSNSERQQQDWQAYLERWAGIFYDPDLPVSGSWKYLSFHDPYHTAKLFPKKQIVAIHLNHFVRKLKRKLV